MNKPVYFILTFSCTLTLILAWVVYGQSNEIEQLKANQPEITNAELDKRIKDLEKFKEFQKPQNAFLKKATTDILTIWFTSYEKGIENARQYFYDDKAFENYKLLLKLTQIEHFALNELYIFNAKVNSLPMQCNRVIDSNREKGDATHSCIVIAKIKAQSGGERKDFDLALKIYFLPTDGLYKDNFKIANIELTSTPNTPFPKYIEDTLKKLNENHKYWQHPKNAFVKTIIENAFTLTTGNRFEKAGQYFSDDALQEYQSILDNLKIADNLKDNKSSFSTEITDFPLNCDFAKFEAPANPNLTSCRIYTKMSLQSENETTELGTRIIALKFVPAKSNDAGYLVTNIQIEKTAD